MKLLYRFALGVCAAASLMAPIKLAADTATPPSPLTNRTNPEITSRINAWQEAKQNVDGSQRVTVKINGNSVVLEIRVISISPVPKPIPPDAITDLEKVITEALGRDRATDAEKAKGLRELSGPYDSLGDSLLDPSQAFTLASLSKLVADSLKNQAEAQKLKATQTAIQEWLEKKVPVSDRTQSLNQDNRKRLSDASKELAKTLDKLATKLTTP